MGGLGDASGAIDLMLGARGALQEQPHDLACGPPIQWAIGHQQADHDIAVQLSIDAHREVIDTETRVQLTGGLAPLDQRADELVIAPALFVALYAARGLARRSKSRGERQAHQFAVAQGKLEYGSDYRPYMGRPP